MPEAKSIHSLESIVIGCADTIFLKDVAGVGELSGERADSVCVGRVDIEHDIQLASFAAYVAELDDRRVAQALFHLETIVVKIRSAEILVDGICRESAGAAVWIRRGVESGARRHIAENRGSSRLHALPVIARQRIVRDRV